MYPTQEGMMLCYVNPYAVREHGRVCQDPNILKSAPVSVSIPRLSLPPEQRLIAVLISITPQDLREGYRTEGRGSCGSSPLWPSWAKLQRLYWAGSLVGIDISEENGEGRAYVREDSTFDYMELYFLDENHLEKGDSRYPLMEITLEEAERNGKMEEFDAWVSQIISSQSTETTSPLVPSELFPTLPPPHTPLPEEKIYMERRTIREETSTSRTFGDLKLMLLDLRGKNIDSGAHCISTIKINPATGGYVRGGTTADGIKSLPDGVEPLPPLELAVSEKEARMLMDEYGAHVKLREGAGPKEWAANLKEKDFPAYIKRYRPSIFGVPLILEETDH